LQDELFDLEIAGSCRNFRFSLAMSSKCAEKAGNFPSSEIFLRFFSGRNGCQHRS